MRIDHDRNREDNTSAGTGRLWARRGIGPAVVEILEGVTAQEAMAHPLAGGHSIWELALHIVAWMRAGLRRLNGDRAQLTDAEDFQAVTDSGERTWEATPDSVRQAHEELRSAILLLDDSRLDQPIIEGMSSVYITLHGGFSTVFTTQVRLRY